MAWLGILIFVLVLIVIITFAIIFSNDKRGFNWPRQKEKDLSKIYDMNQIYQYKKHK